MRWWLSSVSIDVHASNSTTRGINAVFEWFIPFKGFCGWAGHRFAEWDCAYGSWGWKEIGKDFTIHVVFFCLWWWNLKKLGCVTIYCVGRANSPGIGIRHASFEGRSPSFLLLPWAYQSSYIQRHQKIVLFVSKELLLEDMGFPKVKLGVIQWFGI